MSDAVETQLFAYLIICAGVGSIFGAVGGVPGMFPGFFIANMYFWGVLMLCAGVWLFAHSVKRG